MTEAIWQDLEGYCKKPERKLLKDLKKQGFKVTKIGEGDRYYAFQDNGSSVLAVAHMDIAGNIKDKQGIFAMANNVVVSPALDDRLGVFIITKLLPAFGVLPDILLTTDEEKGASTASFFDAPKDYNWVFSFDRSGADVVMYDYKTTALAQLLGAMGFDVGFGSFSDICWLDHLGVSGFNFGTGYYREHTVKCHAQLNTTIFMVGLFIEFFKEFKDTKFEYTPTYGGRYGGYGGYVDYYEAEWEEYFDGSEERLGKIDEYYDHVDDEWKPVDEDETLADGLMSNVITGTKFDAIEFQYAHEDLGHDVDYCILTDSAACVMCFDCDIELIFKDVA